MIKTLKSDVSMEIFLAVLKNKIIIMKWFLNVSFIWKNWIYCDSFKRSGIMFTKKIILFKNANKMFYNN